MSYRCRRLVAFIALESWASHAASCPIHLITLSRTPCDYTSPNYHSQKLVAPGLQLPPWSPRSWLWHVELKLQSLNFPSYSLLRGRLDDPYGPKRKRALFFYKKRKEEALFLPLFPM